jgi:hypothetical protein
MDLTRFMAVSHTLVHGPPVIAAVRRRFRKSRALQTFYQTTNEKLHPYMSAKLPLLVDLQQKVGELALSISLCTTVFILENTLS